MRWEYQVVGYIVHLESAASDHRAQTERLALAGEAGWELVGVMEHSREYQGAYGAWRELFFKRPVEERTTPAYFERMGTRA